MENSSAGGVGIISVLLAIFVILRLTKVVTWSWWWVILGPFAIGFGMVIASVLIAVVVYVLVALCIRMSGC